MPDKKAMESRAFGSPSRYIQGPGEINNLPIFAFHYGKTALAMIDPFFFEEYQKKIPQMFEAHDMTAWTVKFPGVCSSAALEELIEYCKKLPQLPDVFIGVGGGQTCDMNKAVGAFFQKAFINVPTSLATDAPTSTHSIINNPHEMPYLMVHYKNPDYVVVDTEITIHSPVPMFISGIGDALATYVEACASAANNNVCNAGGGNYKPTQLGMAVARLSYDVILEKGRAAVLAAGEQIRTPAYEDVAEATVLLSGLGFECTGVSIAHGLQAGFHVLPGKPLMHGAGVGYCMLVQLVIENDMERLQTLSGFCRDIGLPVCTADLGLCRENRNVYVEKLVDEVYPKRWNVQNMPIHISRDMLINAIYFLDLYTKKQQEENSENENIFG